MKMFLLLFLISGAATAAPLKCQKEAEEMAIADSKKKGNLPASLLSIANPSEMDGKDLVVYIGAHAGYNYYKFDLSQGCKKLKISDVEYVK